MAASNSAIGELNVAAFAAAPVLIAV